MQISDLISDFVSEKNLPVHQIVWLITIETTNILAAAKLIRVNQ